MPKGYDDLLNYINDFIDKEKENGKIKELANEYIYKYIN